MCPGRSGEAVRLKVREQGAQHERVAQRVPAYAGTDYPPDFGARVRQDRACSISDG